jgi:hypothetical protein
MRRGRRGRNTPCRKPRWANRGNSKRTDRNPPSTLARINLRLSIVKKLKQIYPITFLCHETISAETKEGKQNRKWNKSFSPLQVGKKYFAKKAKELISMTTEMEGYETSQLRNKMRLSKTKDKMSNDFDAHAVDSWTLATSLVGHKHNYIDNKSVHVISPIKFTRRQLHYMTYMEGNKRPRFGGTRSLGFTKGSIVRHNKPTKTLLKNNKHNLFLVGGNDGKKLTLCSIDDQSNRVSRTINPKDIKLVAYNKFTYTK